MMLLLTNTWAFLYIRATFFKKRKESGVKKRKEWGDIVYIIYIYNIYIPYINKW